MRPMNLNPESIFEILKDKQPRTRISDLCKDHGIAESTYFSWKKKYGGMSVDQISYLNKIEKENMGLKLEVKSTNKLLQGAKTLLEKKQ